MLLTSEAYVCDPRPDYPFLITAKRYTAPACVPEDTDALTLVFAHGTGYHKEHWEPTLEHIFEHATRDGRVKIRDAWAIDCPNHGDAAVLNERTLLWGYDNFSWEEYARGVYHFLSGVYPGVGVDFSKRNLVGIGHSMGAIALVLANTFLPKPNFVSFVLAEPMSFPKDSMSPNLTVFLTNSAEKRRDIFPSRGEALAWLQSRPGFKVWDPRVLRIFVEHGLRDLPTAEYPDKTDGVTLKCAKTQEAATFRDNCNTGRVRGYNYLLTLCAARPVHVVFGAVDDYIPREVKDRLLKEGILDRYASVRRVPGAGHLVVQTHPRGLADVIWGILSGQSTQEEPRKTRL
ncbi:hypothetical protein FOMPIDRAFT_1170528 [Fomitopsis schrenkii]|uniref:AB hydrolase-1 domain-containing protein n=1 Tax=Fomitopsis schrenkii TaxID=2126942 RepID=S8F3A6_FOMSC|nr:hypothetical protein FOMPIDRAFT_1170528 [Fomitopsis schrenkii]